MGNSTGTTGYRLGYRPELDGIRGVAVGAVVAFHYGVLPGGWLGVDVFFVLSGFLITTLLLTEQRHTGRIDLPAFFRRRVRRLLPAVVLFLAVMALVAAAVGDRTTMTGVMAGLLYVANWTRALGIDGGLVGHLWSLAIEEQFYLLWPFAVVAVGTARRVLAVSLVTVGGVVAWRAWLYFHDAGVGRIYNGLDTRADALMIGCAAAAALWLGYTRWTRRWGWCVAVLAACALLVPRETPWMLAFGYAPLAAAAAGIVVSTVMHRETVVARMLRSAVLVGLGRISYALYLWHFPIEKLTRGTGPAGRVASVAVAVALAVASTYLWEQRFTRRRSGDDPERPQVSDERVDHVGEFGHGHRVGIEGPVGRPVGRRVGALGGRAGQVQDGKAT